MSNYLAVAAATATLADVVRNALRVVPGADVRIGRPEGNKPFLGANLYLYRVAPNGAFRNQDLATRRADGTFLQQPQAALDLYYLISFYTEKRQSDLEPQIMLGSTVSALHAFPVLTRAQVRRAIASYPDLRGADLDEQVETVKFTLITLNLEELSKLWTVFFQTTHALSVAYVASVVLLDAPVVPEPALPVRTPAPSAGPTAPLRLEAVSPTYLPFAADAALTLTVGDASAEGLRVLYGTGQAVAPRPGPTAGTLLAPLAAGLLPGPNRVQVATTDPPAAASNAMTFMLQPVVASAEALTVDDPRVGADDPLRVVRLRVQPDAGAGEPLALLLNEVTGSDAVPHAYTFFTALRFDVAAALGEALDDATVSPALREAFLQQRIRLTDAAAVTVRTAGAVWQITDGAQAYAVRAAGDRLVVYFGLGDLAGDAADDALAFEVPARAATGATLPEPPAPGTYLVRLQVGRHLPVVQSPLTWDADTGVYTGPTVTLS